MIVFKVFDEAHMIPFEAVDGVERHDFMPSEEIEGEKIRGIALDDEWRQE